VEAVAGKAVGLGTIVDGKAGIEPAAAAELLGISRLAAQQEGQCGTGLYKLVTGGAEGMAEAGGHLGLLSKPIRRPSPNPKSRPARKGWIYTFRLRFT
jgi:hypothetical protein